MYAPIHELPSNIRDFVFDVVSEMNRDGIPMHLPLTPRVNFTANLMTSGYFSKEGFAAGLGRPVEEWLRIFTHESCHSDQNRENSRFWRRRINGKDPCELLDNWLERRKEYSDYEVSAFIEAIIELERDCEIRTIRKIQKYNLPIDLTLYCKCANVYMYFYRAVQYYRRWYKADIYTPELLGTVRGDRLGFMSEFRDISFRQSVFFQKVMLA